MQRRRNNTALQMGVVLLLSDMLRFGINRIPPVTLSFIVGQVLLFIGVIDVPWAKSDVCISADNILHKREWKRFIFSSLEHGDDMHLYYNMASFMIKGRTLEKKYGSQNFGILLIILMFVTNVFYVLLGKVSSDVLLDDNIRYSCAIGFSGVIFALKVLTTYEQPNTPTYVAGIRMPGKYSAWAELILIHLLVPNASFIGHFAGILAGVLYTSTFVGTIIDNILFTITGVPMIHGQNTHTSSSYRYQQEEDYTHHTSRNSYNNYYTNNNRYNYGWRNNLFTPQM